MAATSSSVTRRAGRPESPAPPAARPAAARSGVSVAAARSRARRRLVTVVASPTHSRHDASASTQARPAACRSASAASRERSWSVRAGARRAGVGGQPGVRRGLLPGAYRVAQYADACRLQLDDVAGLDPPAELQPASAADRAHGEELTRVDVLAVRRPGEDLGEGEPPAAGGAGGPYLAVDPGRARDVELIDLVHRQDARAHRGAEVLALRRTDGQRHLVELDVAGAEVVEESDAGDVGRGVGGGDVAAAASGEEADLQ